MSGTISLLHSLCVKKVISKFVQFFEHLILVLSSKYESYTFLTKILKEKKSQKGGYPPTKKMKKEFVPLASKNNSRVSFSSSLFLNVYM